MAQFPTSPSNSGPQETERIAGSVRGHCFCCPRSLGISLVTPTLCLLSIHMLLSPPQPGRGLAGLGSKGQVPCSCSKAITPKPHSSWPTDCSCCSPLPGLLIGRNTGTKRKTRSKEGGELDDAIATSPQVRTRGGCLFQLPPYQRLLSFIEWEYLRTSIPFALRPLDSFWEEGASEVFIAETAGGIGEGMDQLAGFQFLLSGDPSQGSDHCRARVDWEWIVRWCSKEQAHKWPEHWSS